MSEKVEIQNLSQPLKILLLFLSILGIVVPAVLGFVNFDKRIDIVESSFVKHTYDADRKHEKVLNSIEENEDAIHALELVDKGLTIQYQEILRRLDENKTMLDNLVRVD